MSKRPKGKIAQGQFLQIRLTPGLKRDVLRRVKRLDTTLSDHIRGFLEQDLENEKEELSKVKKE